MCMYVCTCMLGYTEHVYVCMYMCAGIHRTCVCMYVHVCILPGQLLPIGVFLVLEQVGSNRLQCLKEVALELNLIRWGQY